MPHWIVKVAWTLFVAFALALVLGPMVFWW